MVPRSTSRHWLAVRPLLLVTVVFVTALGTLTFLCSRLRTLTSGDLPVAATVVPENNPKLNEVAGTELIKGHQFITFSADRNHLVNTFTNKPVFVTGESGFSLVGQLSNADIETYFSDREARGFNLIWVAVVDNTYSNHSPQNALGQVPFGALPFLNMQEPFFAHLDYILQLAAAHGITLLLNPAFSGYPCVGGGWCPQMEDASEATMTAFGVYLGSRYKSYPNVIWLIGGDADITHRGKNLQSKLNALAMGIYSVDRVHLMTAENIRGESALDKWSGAPWLRVNSLYNKPPDFPAAANANYLRRDRLPFFLLEDWYEGEHDMTQLGLRQEAYWSVLSGAHLGEVFGNNAIWPFGTAPYVTIAKTWQSQLNSEGSVSRELLGKLFRSREHWKMNPDIDHNVVTGGYGSSWNLSVASRSSDGQTIIVYIPNGSATTLSVDMSKITSAGKKAKGWWFNPSHGSAQLISTFPNTGTRQFTPPDANDWVLVLDDASANLDAPGKSDL